MGTAEPHALTVRSWQPGHPPEIVRGSAVRSAQDASIPLWADLEPVDDPVRIGGRLSQLFPDFNVDMVTELFNPSDNVVDFGPVRLVRSARVRAPYTTPGEPAALVIAPVHILCGPGWLVTSQVAAWSAGGYPAAADRVTPDELIRAADGSWCYMDQGVDDLATLWLLHCARSFKLAATRLALYLTNADLARWDSSSASPTPERLRDLAFSMDTLSIQVRGFQQPGVPPETAWFAPARDASTTTTTVARLVDETATFVDGTRRDVRAVLDRRYAEVAAANDQRRALGVGVLAVLFVGPSLAATVFGAFPRWFEGDAGNRAVALAAASAAGMAITGSLVWALVRSARPTHKRAGLVALATALVVAVCAWVITDLDDPASPSTRKKQPGGRAGKTQPGPQRARAHGRPTKPRQ